MNKIKLSERQEQEIVIKWISMQHPWLLNHTIYIVNEKKCSAFVGAKLNKQGRLAGASDLFIAWPTINYCGLFIEMKSLTGYATKIQKEFIMRMVEVGYYGCVCRGADEAIETIKAYFDNRL